MAVPVIPTISVPTPSFQMIPALNTLIGQINAAFVSALVDAVDNSARINTSTLNAVSTTALQTIPNMSVPISAAGVYEVYAALPVTTGASAGVALALGTAAGLNLASENITGRFTVTNTLATVSTNTIGPAGIVGSTAAVTLAELFGYVTVNTSGTLNLLAGPNASNGTTTSIQTGGIFKVTRLV